MITVMCRYKGGVGRVLEKTVFVWLTTSRYQVKLRFGDLEGFPEEVTSA